MIARGIQESDLRAAAKEVGVSFRGLDRAGRGFRFTLALDGEKYRRFSPFTGHKIAAVCWHGHRDFLRALFTRVPTAKVISSWITYDGLDDFEANHDDTGDRNVGSQMQPQSARDSCRCQV